MMTPEKQWMATLCEGDIDAIVSLYAPDAVLVATFAPEPLRGTRQITGYFRTFLGDHAGLCGRVLSALVQHPAPDVRVCSGLYEFGWNDGTQRARYTYVWRHIGSGRWEIVTHHSSVMP